MDILCDKCRFNVFDEESGEYFCDARLDEDEFARLVEEEKNGKSCRYFIPDSDEYSIVRKQN